ncbi:hypothetical protein EDC39_101461 [Geothermobacter ehrlichii]|uniref:MEMO1 family protein EDC39_101461 n=1 Tax=Geothermobacter ehrlichii TaxID=213224 RepID=A0A5D3WPZ7_9BACT|nr:AmmeMemoRadiSam system protein B [Geothermobacter ehrlichii]TYP00297.1 hypothetical protein EDC39_101461 [Geothermobacter ehrlichii]
MPRKPAVSGQFYPSDGKTLVRQLDAFLGQVDGQEEAVGVVSPHAGYLYSGAIAGAVFARVTVPDEVVVLGPNHHGLGYPGAVYSRGTWETPLGPVAVAEDLADAVLASCPMLAADTLAHRSEHSLEVQLPFIQRRNPAARILPICLAHWPLAELVDLGRRLGQSLASRQPRPLIVASSDMTHYEPGEIAREKDRLAIERILALDAEGLYRVVREHRITMCGVMPTVVLLAAAGELGATRAELVRYGNSGEVTGDQSEVVGYAGIVVR